MATHPNGRRLGITVAIVALIIFCFAPASHPISLWRDFDAFYCAGSTINHGGDPYVAQPLGACEQIDRGPNLEHGSADLILPAPLPPYALVVFSALAHLPYQVAGALWDLILLLSTILTARALARLCRLSGIAIFALLVPTEIFSSGSLGEIAPVAIFAIAQCALAFANKRPRVAAGWSLIAMIQPHVALGAVLALLIYERASRATLVAGVAILAAISVLAVGPRDAWAYLTIVLPAHAIAEIPSTNQISLTALLSSLGSPHSIALAAGTLSLVVMLVVGLVFAGRLAKSEPNDSLIITLPVALGIVGGIFMHVNQIDAALLGTLTLWSRAKPRSRAAFAAISILIAIPWVQFSLLGLGFIVIVAAALTIAVPELYETSNLKGFVVACAFSSVILMLDLVLISRNLPGVALQLPVIKPGDLPEHNWALSMTAISGINADLFDIARAFTWIGTFAMVASITQYVLGRPAPTATSETTT